MEVPLFLDGLFHEQIPLKLMIWLIWGYHHFRKPPNGLISFLIVTDDYFVMKTFIYFSGDSLIHLIFRDFSIVVDIVMMKRDGQL